MEDLLHYHLSRMVFMNAISRIVATLGCVLVLAVAAVEISYGQYVNCPDPCTTPGWTWTEDNRLITMCDSYGCCQFLVYYRYRTGCGKYDLEILSFDNPPDCLQQVVDFGRIVNGAMDYLLRTNPMNFPPTGNGCETNIRVFKAGCYTYSQAQNAIISCGLSCCNQTFTVCANGSVRTVVQTGGVNTVQTCDANSQCYSGCREYSSGVPPEGR